MKVILEKKSKIYFHFDDPSRTTVKTLNWQYNNQKFRENFDFVTNFDFYLKIASCTEKKGSSDQNRLV